MNKFVKGSLVAAFLALLWQFWPDEKRIRETLEEEYDFVIVGAGSAGCVLAARLSEQLNVTVALLEAGREDWAYSPKIQIPIAFIELWGSDADWQYKTTPQQHSCQGFVNKQCSLPRGKVLGGSSSINNMQYMRGSRHDYDGWADNGCDGWSYDDVLPYFMKSETQSNAEYVKSGYHGTDGPMHVEDFTNTPQLTDAFIKAGNELGHDTTDVNGQQQEGVMKNQVNTRSGRRVSTATAYLHPVMTRDNLHVTTEAHVTKVLFNGRRAVGVSYVKRGSTHVVKARKDIILAAGAIGSPHILMLSGVGNKEHLTRHKIDVVAELPVGDNFQDHMYLLSPIYTFKKPVSLPSKDMFDRQLMEFFTWKVFGSGHLQGTSLEAVAFFRTSLQAADDPIPTIQLVLISSALGSGKINRDETMQAFNLQPEDFNDYYSPGWGKHSMTLSPFLLRTKSRGTVRLKSSNPFDDPLVDPHYLEHPDDVHNMLEGIRIAQRLANTSALFQQLEPVAWTKPLSACSDSQFDSDDYWTCFLRHQATSVYHHVGTCKMGSDNDPTAVVNPQLRVRGLDGLRVVDASVMPDVVAGNTNNPTIMIAEKAADMIKEYWAKH